MTLNLAGLVSLEKLWCANNNLTSLALNANSPYSYINVRNNNLADRNAVTGKSITWDGVNFLFDPQRGASVYYYGDIAVMNAIIDNNGLRWPKAPSDGSSIPEEWMVATTGGVQRGVVWSGDAMNKRITRLGLPQLNLSGTLNLSGLTSLRILNCYGNSLTSVVTDGLVNLEGLWCYDNIFTSLDVSRLINLQTLECQLNSLTTLKVGGLANLEKLYCYDNALTSLDLGGLTDLIELDCSGNILTTLDLSGLTNLEKLYYRDNAMTSLDVSGLENLVELNCNGNGITELDISMLENLEKLWCANNNLSGLTLNGDAPYESIDVRLNNLADQSNVTGGSFEWDETNFIFHPQKIASRRMLGFIRTHSYARGQFTDVNENAWYGLNREKAVANAFEYGLMRGNSATIFNPGGNVTVAEAIAIASRVHIIFSEGSDSLVQGSPWYKVYVDYAIENAIIEDDDFSDYTAYVTRAGMAYIFSRSLPPVEFAARNTVNSLPDVDSNTPYCESILMLYRAGVFAGNDTQGTFNPGSLILRAEAAALITRVILHSERVSGRTFG